jgi:hypothetical protein
MARYNHLPIFQAGYAFTLKIHQMTHFFPREHKYALGQRLKEISADFLDLIIIANSLEDKTRSFGEMRIKDE